MSLRGIIIYLSTDIHHILLLLDKLKIIINILSLLHNKSRYPEGYD